MATTCQIPLKEALEKQGRTQAWLARTLGVSRMCVYNWCAGVNCVPDERKVQISDILNEPIEELFFSHLRSYR